MNATTRTPAPTDGNDAPRRSDDLVVRLRQSEIFNDYQQAFQIATGLPLVLRAAGSFLLPLHGSKQINAFCALMAGTGKSCAACLQLQQRVEDEGVTVTKTLECFAGLSESVVPIRLGEKVVAYLQTGQVLLRPPTEKRFRSAVQQLAKWNVTLDPVALHAVYFESRVLTPARYRAVLRLLSSFSEHLSLISNELMMKKASAEHPTAIRARVFIAEHLGEPLSLCHVARAVNMSSFYFCKVFRGATGLRFTEYLARARVEKTKQLLLNPHARVSEAAFEAGFQSLSQFNRVFRRIVGESPSTYRDHLHGPVNKRSGRAPLAFAA